MTASHSSLQTSTINLPSSTFPVPPLDEHNKELLANVHPSDWTNPDPHPRYDLVVIGAGTGGLITAAGAAARIVIQNALFMGRAKLSALTMPWCTYTDPEVAHVGQYETDAKARGFETDTFRVGMDEIDRAQTDGETEGFVKVRVRKGTDKILGATIVSAHAGEMISEITTAMVAKAGLGTLSRAIHPYPTQAEAIKRVADAYNRTRLTPRVASLLKWWVRKF